MKNLFTLLKPVGLLAFIFLAASTADAQATRTYISGVGDDANPCSRTAPCKTLAGTISKTAMNGVMNCIDTTPLGAVTITKSVTIDCTGEYGSILTSGGGNAIIINITNPLDTKKAVKIKDIQIHGIDSGGNGIRIVAANSVDVENVMIDGFTQHGISIETPAKTSVTNCVIRNNEQNGINSIATYSTPLTISNSQILNNVVGLNLSTGAKASLRNVVLAGNGTGLFAYTAEATVSASEISGNQTGVTAVTGGTIRLSGSTITNNATGLSALGGAITSLGNNAIVGNNTNGTPTSTTPLQ